jgi:hypothetical protein
MRFDVLWVVTFSLALVVGCGAPPKQAEAPDVEQGAGVDMAGEEAAPTPKPTDEEAVAAPSADEMHAKCCVACKAGLEKDRTGAKPESIPCSDFTAELTPWCLEHFRDKPTMASACK